MKIPKAILVSAALALGLVVFGYLWRSNYFQKQNSTTAQFNSRYGFTVSYPKDWLIDSSQKEAPVEFIREPTGKALVAIQVMQDDRLKNPALRKQVFKEAEDAFRQTESYTVNSFEWAPPDVGLNTDSYMAMGSFIKDNTKWLFREVGIFNHSGSVFFLRGNTLPEVAKTDGPMVDKIIFSFKPQTPATK